MPIDYSRYPADWKTRSRFVRFVRARNRCEWCGAVNGAWGYRDEAGNFHETGEDQAVALGEKPLRIVLTVAHVFDHRPAACSLLNLAALCQRCHLRHDARLHAEHAAARRRAADPTPQLFAEETR